MSYSTLRGYRNPLNTVQFNVRNLPFLAPPAATHDAATTTTTADDDATAYATPSWRPAHDGAAAAHGTARPIDRR